MLVELAAMNIDKPFDPAAASVFPATKYRSASAPLVMNIFVPFSTQPSPWRFALVRIAFTSEPASGSVTATAVMASPEIIFGRNRLICSGVPAFTRCGDAMSVCTSTVMAKPPNVERPSSSASSAVALASSPAPPNSSGYLRPR